ncbi:MAG: MscL family protein [Candidatus Kaiserbacteria bacterium]|nr:MAG: MscL family protein [Candidatus Kaiserbacteria bacterium]
MTDDLKVIQTQTPENVPPRQPTILAAPERAFAGFVQFIRERGVMGLAIGFVLGSSVQKVVTALVTDIINPLIGLLTGEGDKNFSQFTVGPFLVGDFISVLIDFLILAAVVYFVFKSLKLEQLDKPKE